MNQTLDNRSVADNENSKWMWAPAIGIGMAALSSVVLLVFVQLVRPEGVAEHPYLAARDFDAEKCADQRFIAIGGHFTARVDGASMRLSCTVAKGALSAATITLYRPDQSGADRLLPWSETGHELSVPLPLRGRWQVQLNATSADGAVRAELGFERP